MGVKNQITRTGLYNEVTYKTQYFPMNIVRELVLQKPYFVAHALVVVKQPYRLLSQMFGSDI